MVSVSAKKVFKKISCLCTFKKCLSYCRTLQYFLGVCIRMYLLKNMYSVQITKVGVLDYRIMIMLLLLISFTKVLARSYIFMYICTFIMSIPCRPSTVPLKFCIQLYVYSNRCTICAMQIV
jgi:hypothetical protein